MFVIAFGGTLKV